MEELESKGMLRKKRTKPVEQEPDIPEPTPEPDVEPDVAPNPKSKPKPKARPAVNRIKKIAAQ